MKNCCVYSHKHITPIQDEKLIGEPEKEINHLKTEIKELPELIRKAGRTKKTEGGKMRKKIANFSVNSG